MRIGELASESGISPQAVRFYERAGLLKEPARTQSGYRQYGPLDLKRLRFIRQAKDLGFTLNEIGSMLRMHDAGHAPCSEVIAIAERHLAEVESEIQRLQRFRRQLSSALSEWRKVKPRRVAGSAICELIERTFADRDAKVAPIRQIANGNGGERVSGGRKRPLHDQFPVLEEQPPQGAAAHRSSGGGR